MAGENRRADEEHDDMGSLSRLVEFRNGHHQPVWERIAGQDDSGLPGSRPDEPRGLLDKAITQEHAAKYALSFDFYMPENGRQRCCAIQ